MRPTPVHPPSSGLGRGKALPAWASWEGVEGPGTIDIIVVPEIVVECVHRTWSGRSVLSLVYVRDSAPYARRLSIQPFRIFKYSERDMEQHGT